MSDNQKRILDMLAEGKITADEAQKLLAAISSGGDEAKSSGAPSRSPKYMRVVIQPNPEASKEDVKRVNVRVPVSLIRAGIKFTSLIPPEASDQVNEALREKGIDFDVRNLKPEDMEELIMALHDLEVDVQNGQEKVHVYVE
jgi:Fe-S-cluster formation regulator IscX/YfhJ/polyhydroxyalkanoate synthesis regulator phasin